MDAADEQANHPPALPTLVVNEGRHKSKIPHVNNVTAIEPINK